MCVDVAIPLLMNSTLMFRIVKMRKGAQDMTTQQSINQAKSDAFLGKVLTDTSGMTVTVMASIGDRLGLFKELAHTSANSVKLPTRPSLNEPSLPHCLT